MKEIEFRAWDKINYRFLSMPLVGIDFENDCINSYEVVQISDTEYKQVQNVCCSYELMQYTGLKDKNGVKIFEGDVVTTYFGNQKVHFADGCYYAGDASLLDCLQIGGDEFNIIGNIYENPELLEVK